MRRALLVASVAVLVGLAWAGITLALDSPCAGAPDCFDERGPMHPVLALRLALVGAVVTLTGVGLARRIRPGYAAGLQLAVALVTSFPLVLQRLPEDLRVWLVPTLAQWVAFIGLAIADRAREGLWR